MTDVELESKRLDLERYKAALDYRKAIIVGGYVALALALVPPLFQLATAGLEYVRGINQLNADQQNKNAERQAKSEEFRDDYVKDFLDKALNQDIELRIRLARYFSFVASEDARKGWGDYYKDLHDQRGAIRAEIDTMELALAKLQARDSSTRDTMEEDRLIRHLDWAYNEVGYVPRNRSVTSNPRATDASFPSVPLKITLNNLAAEKRPVAQKIIDAFASSGLGVAQQAAAVGLAMAYTDLTPGARSRDGIGLYAISQKGWGKGFSDAELLDPDVNIALILKAARGDARFTAANNLLDACEALVRNVDRPVNPTQTAVKVLSLAKSLVTDDTLGQAGAP